MNNIENASQLYTGTNNISSDSVSSTPVGSISNELVDNVDKNYAADPAENTDQSSLTENTDSGSASSSASSSITDLLNRFINNLMSLLSGLSGNNGEEEPELSTSEDTMVQNDVNTGSGDDEINVYGQNAQNYLRAGSGDDIFDIGGMNNENDITMGSGDDLAYVYYEGDNNISWIDGGSGNDTIVFQGSEDDYTIDGDQYIDMDGNVTVVSNVEDIYFDSEPDVPITDMDRSELIDMFQLPQQMEFQLTPEQIAAVKSGTSDSAVIQPNLDQYEEMMGGVDNLKNSIQQCALEFGTDLELTPEQIQAIKEDKPGSETFSLTDNQLSTMIDSGLKLGAENNFKPGNPFAWRDLDQDGDADMILSVDKNVNQDDLEHAIDELESGSNGKIDVQAIYGQDQNPYPDYASTVTTEDDGRPGEGETAGRGIMSDVWADSGGGEGSLVLLHELMHAAGVAADDEVNHDDSIMDYDYTQDVLTGFDKQMLNDMYANFNPDSNTTDNQDIVSAEQVSTT